MDDETVAALRLAARGLVTQAVASELDLPVEVVRCRLQQAVRILGAGSKLEAVIIALRQGLI